MLNRALARAAAIVLLFSFPVTLLPAQTEASSQTGVIYPQAGVTLKGSPVVTSTAVHAGDEIKTGNLSTLLTSDGVSLMLKPNTSLKFGKAAELGCGGLVLVTSKAVPVRFAGMEVTPEGNPAKLEVTNAGGTTTVAVKSGAATVRQAGQVSRLAAGQSITRPGTQQCPTAVAGQQATTEPAMSSSFLGGHGLYWVIGGAAGAGVVAGILATRGGERVSPSAP
ncbi:MAG: hypothetical protein ACM3PW_05510 [Chlamydiota bacterium]